MLERVLILTRSTKLTTKTPTITKDNNNDSPATTATHGPNHGNPRTRLSSLDSTTRKTTMTSSLWSHSTSFQYAVLRHGGSVFFPLSPMSPFFSQYQPTTEPGQQRRQSPDHTTRVLTQQQPEQQCVLATSAASSTFPSNGSPFYRSSSSLSSLSSASSSSPSGGIIRDEHRTVLGYRKLCQDRRGPLDHLQPNSLFKNAIRVTVQQGALIYSQYMSDQLKSDLARDEKVQRGELSSAEAEVQGDEWNQKEWDKRWKNFPERLLTAYLKYHAVTAIMRFYEYIVSRNMSLAQLDKLTLDPFAAARRRYKSSQQSLSPTETARECWDSNLIAYLSDYTLHQLILTFGYYVYVRNHFKQKKKRNSSQQQQTPPQKSKASQSSSDDKGSTGDSSSDELHTGSLVLSFLKKSTILGLSRFIGLFFASIGGAVGAVVLPGGWGVLMGINLGDSIGSQVTEEFVHNNNSSNDKNNNNNNAAAVGGAP